MRKTLSRFSISSIRISRYTCATSYLFKVKITAPCGHAMSFWSCLYKILSIIGTKYESVLPDPVQEFRKKLRPFLTVYSESSWIFLRGYRFLLFKLANRYGWSCVFCDRWYLRQNLIIINNKQTYQGSI